MPEGTSACAGRYPHCTWRDLCLAGTVTQNLADHVPVAWGWGEDVQALGSGGRGVCAAVSVRRAQAAKLRRGPAATSRLVSSTRPVWMAFGSTGCCSRKG